MDDVYKVGTRYRDSRNHSEDEFLAWIKGPLEKGISALGGIRPLYGRNEDIEDELAAIILVSSDLDRSDAENAWEDVFNLSEGWIQYWGDAKQTDHDVSTVDPDSFPGNQAMRRAHQLDSDGSRHRYPPILAFRKEEPGYVRFQGLTIIERVEIEEFDSRGMLTPNYLFHLGILDVEEVPLDWIHDRAGDLSNSKAPSQWLDWVEEGALSANLRYSRGEFAEVNDRSLLDPRGQGGDTSGTIRQSSREEVRISRSFANQVYDAFNHECVVTGLSERELLTVSHILDRADRPELAEDIGNVLLLSWTHHHAFDEGFYTFDTSGRLRADPGWYPSTAWLEHTITAKEGEVVLNLDALPTSEERLSEHNNQLDWI